MKILSWTSLSLSADGRESNLGEWSEPAGTFRPPDIRRSKSDSIKKMPFSNGA
jgi:hypothetical protein